MTNDPGDAWARCLTALKGKLFSQSYNTWLRPLTCRSFDARRVVLEAPHSFSVSWIEEHYLKDIRKVIRQLHGVTPEVELVVGGQQQVEQANLWQLPGNAHSGAPFTAPRLSPPLTDQPTVTVSSASVPSGNGSNVTLTLNGDYTFESFVVGSSNEVAFTAAQTVAAGPGSTPFNPLLIYGGVGLGKTHILQAIAESCVRSATAARPLYVTSEEFGREFVTSLKENRTLQFAKRFRQADVLMVDDVQFFENKERMQEEFFHTFNTLHTQGKQIILSSDRPPEALKGLQDRLLSRIQWGLVADIQPPDLETRMAICQKKAESGGLAISDTIAEYIASQVQSNIRELEGIVKRVLFLVEKLHAKLSMEVVERALRTGRTVAPPEQITVARIQGAVASHFHMPPSGLMGTSRRADLVLKRQLAMYLCKVYSGDSLRTIGEAFGGRNHATVMHACQKFQRRLLADPTLLVEVNSVAAALGCPAVELSAL